MLNKNKNKNKNQLNKDVRIQNERELAVPWVIATLLILSFTQYLTN
ncbi:hypothetical protein [Colwellia piezophila]|nr:hypothetical protein [Colwellia piezophila]